MIPIGLHPTTLRFPCGPHGYGSHDGYGPDDPNDLDMRESWS